MERELQTNPAVVRTGAGGMALEQQRVLRNTYLLLALTMVPTIIGAMIGIRTGGIIMQHPIISFFLMLGAVIGLQYAIAANRDSGLGIVLLLVMTLLLGWFLGPLLAVALALKNGPQLIGLAAFVWFIALLVTTAQSPTKQGLHDQYAGTVVVKAARAVG